MKLFFFSLTAKIQIRPLGEGISVYAPSHGLQEVYFDKNSWTVNATLTYKIEITFFSCFFCMN